MHDDEFGHWLTGFSLSSKVRFRSRTKKHGIAVSFEIKTRDYWVLNRVYHELGVGSLHLKETGIYPAVIYIVDNVDELIDVIIPHFEKYPLHEGGKADEYQVWKKLVLEQAFN